MKRKTVIIILVVQTALMLYSFIYSFVQEGIAKEQEMIASENKRMAIEHEKLSVQKSLRFKKEFDRLKRRVAELESELSNCKKK